MSISRLPAHLLIVDDDAPVRDVLAAILMDEGYRCVTAGGALEAMDLVEAHDFDLIISDLKMPGHDGLWLLERLREVCSDLPVLILTGHGGEESAAECARRGAAGFLLKPPSMGELFEAIEGVLTAARG